MLGLKFKRQYSVDHLVIDFYCPELKLAVELDGASHNDPEQKKYDIKRQKYLEEFNIKFVRIKDEDLFGNPNQAFTKIETAIKLLEKNKNNLSLQSPLLSKERGRCEVVELKQKNFNNKNIYEQK